jgi:hypothetical protein
MKPVSVLLLVSALFFACKKDKDKYEPKTVLLSATYTNGNLSYKFSYTSENKLSKVEAYNEKSPSALVASIVVEYHSNGDINQLTTYSEPGHSATSRTIIDSSNNGNIIKFSNYNLLGPSPNTPGSINKRTYNAQGWLSKQESRDKSGDLINTLNVSYYPDGSVKQLDQYKEESNMLYQTEKRVYAIPGTLRPKGLDAVETVLGFEFTAPFFNEGYQTFSYDQNGGITFQRQYLMSGREYSAESTLTRQTITVKKVKPVGTDEIFSKQYEYITQ